MTAIQKALNDNKTDGTIIEFLLGSHSYEGVWLGCRHPTRKGAFWWREILREFAAPPPSSEGETVKINIPHSLFDIPIDIEGGNIGLIVWIPSKEDFKHIGEDLYEDAVKEYKIKNEKVCFKNTHLDWETCDCGDGYGCSHGSWVYNITISDDNGNHDVYIEDGDSLHFENKATEKCATIPLPASVGDFYRACVMCGIKLELTDYAATLPTREPEEKEKFAIRFSEWLMIQCDYKNHCVWEYQGEEYTQQELIEIFKRMTPSRPSLPTQSITN